MGKKINENQIFLATK